MRSSPLATLALFCPAFLLAGQVHAAQLEDETCLPCHEEVELEREHDAHWQEGIMCVECHATLFEWEFEGVEDEEHDESPAQCASCHRDSVKSFRGGAHHADDMECSECHGDHETKWVKDWLPKSQRTCLLCHEDQAEELHESVHIPWNDRDNRGYPLCVNCHTDTHRAGAESWDVLLQKQAETRACLECHEKDMSGYLDSKHWAELFDASNPDAPSCSDCHGGHAAQRPNSALTGTQSCLECHEDAQMSLHHPEGEAPPDLECSTCHSGHQTSKESIADRLFRPGGLDNCRYCHSDDHHQGENLAHDSGLCAEALEQPDLSCIDCHTYHWDVQDGKAIPGTSHQSCDSCHEEEAADYKRSAHARSRAVGNQEPAWCTDCHGEKGILRAGSDFNPTHSVKTCVECHGNKPLMLSYGVNPYVEEGFGDTYHGKLFDVLNTGKEFAVCTDCHGHHDILEPEDPASSVSRNRLLETCKECHEDATEDFVRYISHPKRPNPDELAAAVAAANRPEKILRVGLDPVDLVPVGPPGGSKGMAAFLHGADVFMKILFASVMTFFGLHTFLWFFRGVRQKHRPDVKYIKRFNRFERMLHIMVNVSFLALAFTGLPQTYSHTPMGRWILENIMDLETAQVVHYWAAILTGLYFVLHLAQVAVNLRKKGWRHVLTGPNSLVPRWKDVLDFIGHVRWFLRGGEKPKFGRWTYWEKFDYLAVFWGVAVIGISGLIRWQEEFFGNLFGGEFVSLATTIHKEEALLATAFIFVVHFFNTHMRTEKFPMDVCVYTGVIPEEELKEERPEQWELLVDSGELDSLRTGAKPTITVLLSTIWGGLALATGLFLLVLILLGALKG